MMVVGFLVDGILARLPMVHIAHGYILQGESLSKIRYYVN
jgi:hypothetical protein